MSAGAKTGGEEPVMVRRLLQRCDLADAQRFKGQQVELFWPEDATWWLARIIKVSLPAWSLVSLQALEAVVHAVCKSRQSACPVYSIP